MNQQEAIKQAILARSARDSAFRHAAKRFMANAGAVEKSEDSRQQRRARQRAATK